MHDGDRQGAFAVMVEARKEGEPLMDTAD